MLVAAASLAKPAASAEPVSCGADSTAAASSCSLRAFDVARYRPEDPRIDLIERKGYQGSGLFSRGRTLAEPSQLPKVLPALVPGAELVIADGIWSDVNMTIRANGTWSQPILVRPESPGGVHFIGKTRIDVVGSNIIVADLTIRDGTYPTTTSVLEVGTSTQPCNACVVIGLHMQSLSAAAGSKLHFLGIRGKDVTVANSTFGRARSPGHFIYDSFPTEAGAPAQLHLLRNLFFDRSAVSNENGYELLQLGESTVQAQSMYGRVEGNTFRDSLVPHRDTELVTVKSSDWLIRRNSFVNTVGSLSLRSANRVAVEQNRFLGGGALSASGVRVEGAGHYVVGNYFAQNANPPPVSFPANSAYYYSVVVPAGTVEEVADGEAGQPVAKDVVIANNTFTNGRYNIHLGSFYPGYPLLPRRVQVLGNSIRTTEPLPMFALPKGSEILYLCSNTVEGNTLIGAVTGLQGFLQPAANPHARSAVR